MPDLAPGRLREQRRERREVGDPDRVDQRDLAAGRDLDEAEARPERPLEDELGVESDAGGGAGGAGGPLARDARGELLGAVDPDRSGRLRGRRLAVRRWHRHSLAPSASESPVPSPERLFVLSARFVAGPVAGSEVVSSAGRQVSSVARSFRLLSGPRKLPVTAALPAVDRGKPQGAVTGQEVAPEVVQTMRPSRAGAIGSFPRR